MILPDDIRNAQERERRAAREPLGPKPASCHGNAGSASRERQADTSPCPENAKVPC